MSSRPSAVRSIRHRTYGSGTRLVDEFPVPASAYHAGRGARWAWRNRRGVGMVALVGVLWWATGALAIALVIFGVSLAVSLTVWVRYRSTGAVAPVTSFRDALAGMRQRRTLEKQWPLACKTAGLLGPDRGGPPSLQKVRATGSGTITAVVRSGKIGVPVPSIQKATVTLAEVVGCREVVVTPTGPGVASLAFHWRDPVGRLLKLADLPVAPRGHLAYGIRQDGGVASIVATQSVLIGGLTRSGKSQVVNTLLADAIRQQVPVRLFISDPKGGVELDAFERQLGQTGGLFEVAEYAKTPEATMKMVERVEKAMHHRQWWMKEHGTKKIAPDVTNPLVVLVLDETLPLTDMLRRGTDSPLGRVAYTGAAAGYVVWANTQVAQVDSIGRFRDLIPQRICFATPNSFTTDSVLGQGAESLGARCSDIREPGVGFSHTEGQRAAQKFRAALVSDSEAVQVATGRLPKAIVDKTIELYDRAAERDRGDRETALYRWFHADAPAGARPAYVGISYDVLAREAQHSAALRQFMDGDVRREVEWWPTRREAAAAEKRAIEGEKPIFNVQFNGRNAHRRVDRVKHALSRS